MGHTSTHFTRSPTCWALPTKNCTEAKENAQNHITAMTYFEREYVTLDLKGKRTTKKRSIPMAIFVITLAATEKS